MTFTKKEYKNCMYKGCNKRLPHDYETWFLTIDNKLNSFCEKHYIIKEKQKKINE